MPDPRPLESLAWELLISEAISQAELDAKQGRSTDLVPQLKAVPLDSQGRPQTKSPEYAPFAKMHARYLRVLSGSVTGKHGGAALDAKAPSFQIASASGWKHIKLKAKRREDDAWMSVSGTSKSFFHPNASNQAILETQAGASSEWKHIDLEVSGPLECPAGIATRVQVRGPDTRVSKRLPCQLTFPVSAKPPEAWPADFSPWRRPESLSANWEIKVPSPFDSLPDITLKVQVWPQVQWKGQLIFDWDLASDWWSVQGEIIAHFTRDQVDVTSTWSSSLEEKWMMLIRLRGTLDHFKRWLSEAQNLNPGLGQEGLLHLQTKPITVRLESEGKEAKDHWKIYPDYQLEIDAPNWVHMTGSWEISKGLSLWTLPESWVSRLELTLNGSDSGLWLRASGSWGMQFYWRQHAGSAPNANGKAQGSVQFTSETRLGFQHPGWSLILFSGSLEEPTIPSLATLDGKADFSGQEEGRMEPGMWLGAHFPGHGLWGVHRLGWGTASFDPDPASAPVPLAEAWSFPEASPSSPPPLL